MKKELIDKLLPGKISLAGICRVGGVSAQWLQSYANEKYENTEAGRYETNQAIASF